MLRGYPSVLAGGHTQKRFHAKHAPDPIRSW